MDSTSLSFFLVIGIVVINLAWMAYLSNIDKRHRQDRRELLNRLAEPRLIVPPDEVVEANVEAFKKAYSEDFNEEEALEAAAVGNVNPELRRTDG